MAGDLRTTIRISARNEAGPALQSLKTGIDSVQRSASLLVKGFALFLGAQVTGVISSQARQLLRLADAYNATNARLRLATRSMQEFGTAQRELFDIAQRTRSAVNDTVNLYARMADSVRVLGGTQRETLGLTESVNQAIQLSGASTSSAAAAVQQLGQALASGVLRGDEFNSVMENAPRLARALADGLGVPLGALRALAEEGELTAERIVGALLSQREKLAAEYAQLPQSVGGAFQQIENAFARFVGQTDQATGATQTLAAGLIAVANNFNAIAEAILRAAGVIAAALLARAVPALVTYIANLRAMRAAQLAAAAAAVEAARNDALLAAQRQFLATQLAVLQIAEAKRTADLGLAVSATRALTVATEAQVLAQQKLQAVLAPTVGGIGRLSGAMNLLIAGIAGFQIGTYLHDQFALVRKGGVLLVGSLKLGFEEVRAGWEALKAIFNDDTIEQVLARFKQRAGAIFEDAKILLEEAGKPPSAELPAAAQAGADQAGIANAGAPGTDKVPDLISALAEQAITAGKTAREVDLYKASILGATSAQVAMIESLHDLKDAASALDALKQKGDEVKKSFADTRAEIGAAVRSPTPSGKSILELNAFTPQRKIGAAEDALAKGDTEKALADVEAARQQIVELAREGRSTEQFLNTLLSQAAAVATKAVEGQKATQEQRITEIKTNLQELAKDANIPIKLDSSKVAGELESVHAALQGEANKKPIVWPVILGAPKGGPGGAPRPPMAKQAAALSSAPVARRATGSLRAFQAVSTCCVQRQ